MCQSLGLRGGGRAPPKDFFRVNLRRIRPFLWTYRTICERRSRPVRFVSTVPPSYETTYRVYTPIAIGSN